MVEYDTNWQSVYSDMIATPKKAVASVRPGQRVFVGTGCGEPVELVAALTNRAGELADVEIVQLFTKGIINCAKLAIEKREPYFVEKDEETCIDCPLLQHKESKNSHHRRLIIFLFLQLRLDLSFKNSIQSH